MRIAVMVQLFIALIATSLVRNEIWIDDGAIWLDSITKSPNKARGYNELGLHAIQVADYPLALKAFSHSLRLNPYLIQAHINIGQAYEGMNQIDQAITTYERAIGMSPFDPIPYYNLGLVYMRSKHDDKKALELFLKARDLDPLEPDVHQHLGFIYFRMGLLEQSREELRLFKKLK